MPAEVAARPRQLNSVNPGEKIIRHGEIRYEMHGIGVAADHVGEMPVHRCQNLVFRQDRDFQRVSPADAALALIAIANAIEFQSHLIFGDMLH